jgi:hypothetical protein
MPLLVACSNPQARHANANDHNEASAAGVVVKSVGAPVYTPLPGKTDDRAMAASCRAWVLDRDQVARFFAASHEYPDGFGDAFYSLPCTISGELRAQGRLWTYEINAAATATWTSGETVRRFGCAEAVCEPLVLLMPDDNSGR